jgi:hypothetical protein
MQDMDHPQALRSTLAGHARQNPASRALAVIPAQAGIQHLRDAATTLGSGFRRNDDQSR